MPRYSKPRRWAFLPGRVLALEDRALMSSIGHPTLARSLELIDLRAEVRRTELHARETLAQPGGRRAHHGSDWPEAGAIASTSKRWSWFAKTYWYVPTANVPATLYDNSTGTIVPVLDQTVFEITGYSNGYFWGKTVTQLGSSSPSGSSMVGSVTPQGKVLLTFTATSGSSPSVTEGFGTMVRKHGQWTMENQMFTSPSSALQIGHWAYMVRTRPGLASWNDLPSAGVSVPEFLSESPGTGPQPVGF